MELTRIYVTGLGAVSPAGWGVNALRTAIERDEPIAPRSIRGPHGQPPRRISDVPAPVPRPDFFAHPRLRRVSPLTLFSVGAALEAARQAAVPGSHPGRLGLIVCLLAGCVQYSYRFFDEALRDPATASPLLFPETVFNAAASHVSVLLGQATLTYTLLGDATTFLQGVALGATWLLDQRVDQCLVLGAEEPNWLLADVLWHFDHQAVLGGGAGALCLGRAQQALPVELQSITDPHGFGSGRESRIALQRLREALPPLGTGDLLCDSTQGRARADHAEHTVWQDWQGPRLSPKRILGEGLMASAAWQCVAACDALGRDGFRGVHVSVAGTNHQAIGARFVRSGPNS